MSRSLVKRDNFREFFLKFLLGDPGLKEALIKTYGPNVYQREMKKLLNIDNLAEKIDTFRLLKTVYPGLYIKDVYAWNDYLELLSISSNETVRENLLYLLNFFDPAIAISFILDNLLGGEKAAFKLTYEVHEILIETLLNFYVDAVPYMLQRAPLKSPELVRILTPFYIRASRGSFKDLFERVAESFDIKKHELIDPFISAFLDSGMVAEVAQPLLLRFFIIPYMDKFPFRASYFMKKILQCTGIESVEEYKETLLRHLSRLFKSLRHTDIASALDFIGRYPVEEAAEFLDFLIEHLPGMRQAIYESFREVKSDKVTEIFLRQYPNSNTKEKSHILRYLLKHADEQIMSFIDEQYKKAFREEKGLILQNLWQCPSPAGKEWIRDAFKSGEIELIKAAVQKMHYLGMYFERDEFNSLVLEAHKKSVPVSKGFLNPMIHLVNPELCGELIKNIDTFNDEIRGERLVLAGYCAGEEAFPAYKKYCYEPEVAIKAIKGLALSKDPFGIELITELYKNSDKSIKSFIADTIIQTQDHRFAEIIKIEAEMYCARVDSYTPENIFIVPIDKKTGFKLLKAILKKKAVISVQLMIELALYGGAEALPVLEKYSKSSAILESPKKLIGYSLAKFIAGKEDEKDYLLSNLSDAYLGNYIIYLLHGITKRMDDTLLPSLEKLEPVNFTPFVESLLGQMKYFLSWDPIHNQILEILSEHVDEERSEETAKYLLGEFMDFKMPVLKALERLENPDTIPVLRDGLSMMEMTNIENIPNHEEIFYRISKLLYNMGGRSPYKRLKMLYGERLIRYLENPHLFINKEQYLPDFADIVEKENRAELFLKYFDRYLGDSSDMRYSSEALLKMVKGINDKRLIAPIAKKLRLYEKEVDLVPALERLKELTGKTYGLDYEKWKKYIK